MKKKVQQKLKAFCILTEEGYIVTDITHNGVYEGSVWRDKAHAKKVAKAISIDADDVHSVIPCFILYEGR